VTPALIDASGVRRSCVTDENIAARSSLVSASSCASRARASSRARSSATAAWRVAASSSSFSRRVNDRARAGRSVVSVPKGTDATTTGRISLGPPSSTSSRRATALISWPSSTTWTLHIANPNGSISSATNSSSTRSGTSPVSSLLDSRASSRASRSRSVARRRSAAALPTTSPTTAAMARNTTEAITSRSCSNWNPCAGCSIHGNMTEDSNAVTMPAQMPPLTAAIVTASMKIATPAPGPRSLVRTTRIAPQTAAPSPMARARTET